MQIKIECVKSIIIWGRISRLLILFMSILLIGQRNRYCSLQRSTLTSNEENDDLKKDKKQAKELYRLDLLAQMRESSQRRKKQKQREIKLDRHYEQLFYDQVAEPHHRYQTETKPPSRFQAVQSSFSSPQQKRYKEGCLALPPIQKDHYSKSKKSRMCTEPVEPLYKDKIGLKQRPEHQGESYKSEMRYSNIFELETPETRQKKLQEELENKLSQVYELMAQSVKTLKQTQELQNVGTKLSPIRLGLDKGGYKVKYPDYASPSSANPQENRDYFKLPNISNNFRENQFSQQESEAEWREWYAKQKLRELQSKYQRELNVQASDIRLGHRTKTPKFQLQQQV